MECPEARWWGKDQRLGIFRVSSWQVLVQISHGVIIRIAAMSFIKNFNCHVERPLLPRYFVTRPTVR